MDKYEVRFIDPLNSLDRNNIFEGKDAKERAVSYAQILNESWNVTVNVVCIKEEFVAAYLKKNV